jgi:hypothetical protein
MELRGPDGGRKKEKRGYDTFDGGRKEGITNETAIYINTQLSPIHGDDVSHDAAAEATGTDELSSDTLPDGTDCAVRA